MPVAYYRLLLLLSRVVLLSHFYINDQWSATESHGGFCLGVSHVPRNTFRPRVSSVFSLNAVLYPSKVPKVPDVVARRLGVSRNLIDSRCVRSIYAFISAAGYGANAASAALPRRWHCAQSLDEEDNHRLLKEVALNKEEHLAKSLDPKCSFYRYFNITRSNVGEHLRKTMDEHFESEREQAARSLYVVDGNAFNGDYTNWRLPIPREMASYDFEGVNPKAGEPLSAQGDEVKPRFGDAMLDSIHTVISEADSADCVKGAEALCDLYDEVGDYEYYETCRGKVIKKDYLEDVDILITDETKREREMRHNVLSQPTAFPSYLDPVNPAHRTGRGRELQRRSDSGSCAVYLRHHYVGRLQRLRWNMDVDPADDILRGPRKTGNSVTKEFVDSIEWEQPMPTHHDRNFFKRSFAEGGFGEPDRTVDSYFDVQFIGSPDAYPYAISAGMQFTWPIYWVPLLAKKHPKRYCQPLRSPVFNLGGIEPLQLWFYPEGSASSTDGFCSLKLVSPPGWCLPYRIYLFVFSEYNRVVAGPMYRESAEYVARSLNFCRLLDKSDKERIRMRENDKDYVILGPAGNVYAGVGIVDEPVRSKDGAHRFAYDWDEGDYDFNQWLKKQTADPDDAFQQENVDRERTHSIWYESHKYKYVPDRHISRYWRSRYSKELDWRQPTF
ncbi:hypothetical protein, conserved [Babesia bigemina]|uniref:Uncharacterized protein n=1 Tax=Babesia bigemina TaxID=5866 RepID=A0A061D9Q3_BABBI|nr:hypothetical protein, conserved [Babesia bigemina]CDR95649.1 hypothetical protein, conserved [Babesia bigemina]|eukprot:XP_012767835.1 hypothetical protein, conserved [Babesia bigemina]